MKKMIMISLFILILVTSCKNDTTSPVINPLNTDELIPLKIGNTWDYEYTEYHGSDQMKVKATTSVVSDIQYQGERYFLMQHTEHGTGETMIPKVYYINKSDGHYMILLEDNEEPETIKINYPTFVGDIIHEDENYKFYVEKVDHIYTTPAGKFKCIKYVQILYYDGKELERIINYIAPGIGRVADEIYSTNTLSGIQNLDEQYILQSYQLK